MTRLNCLDKALMKQADMTISKTELIDLFLKVQMEHQGFMNNLTVKELIEYAQKLGFTVIHKRAVIKPAPIIKDQPLQFGDPKTFMGIDYYLDCKDQNELTKLVKSIWKQRNKPKQHKYITRESLTILVKHMSLKDIAYLYNTRLSYVKERIKLVEQGNPLYNSKYDR